MYTQETLLSYLQQVTCTIMFIEALITNKLKTIKPQSHQWENRNMNYDSVIFTAINPASSNKVNLS